MDSQGYLVNARQFCFIRAESENFVSEQDDLDRTVKPTFARAMRLLFEFSWRFLGYVLVGVVVAGLTLGVATAVLDTTAEQQKWLSWIASYVVTVPATMYAASHCVGRKIGDFRILMVKAD